MFCNDSLIPHDVNYFIVIICYFGNKGKVLDSFSNGLETAVVLEIRITRKWYLCCQIWFSAITIIWDFAAMKPNEYNYMELSWRVVWLTGWNDTIVASVDIPVRVSDIKIRRLAMGINFFVSRGFSIWKLSLNLSSCVLLWGRLGIDRMAAA